MPFDYRLGVAIMYKPEEFWFPVPRGGWEMLFLVVGSIFYVVTAPYRILFFLPLMLSPRLLVWPVAVLWAMLWVASWLWGLTVAYRRLQKAIREDIKKFAGDMPGEDLNKKSRN